MTKNNDYFCIKIINWDKYQTRKDLKSMSFFRLQSHLFSDQKFMQLTQGEMILWIYLLAECSKRMTSEIQVFDKQVTTLCKLRTSKVKDGLNHLEQLQLLNILSRNESVSKSRVEYSRVEKSRVKSARAKSPSKISDEKLNIDSFDEFVQKFDPTYQAELIEKYKNQNWIKEELEHAILWNKENGKPRTQNGWKLFFTGWFKRAKKPSSLDSGQHKNSTQKTFAEKSADNILNVRQRALERYGAKND